MSPTGLTAALIAGLALSALVLPLEIPLLAYCGLIAATAVDALSVRRPPEVERTLPDLLSRGVPEEIRITVRPPRGSSPTIRQAVPDDIELEPAIVQGPELVGRIVARRRGRHVLPPVAVRLRGALGLAAWIHHADGERAVEVYPDLPAARRAVAAARNARFRDQGNRGRGPLGLGTEFERVREYQPDDDIRQVNWRATARLGRPMSNDFRLEQDRDVICAIDCGRLMRAPLLDRSRLDAAIDATAAVAAAADEFGDRFGVLAFDDGRRVWRPPVRDGGRDGLRSLYDLEPVAHDSDFNAAFQNLERSKRALVFLFTDLVEEVAARPMVEAMPVLARKHAVTLVSATDLELAGAVTEPATELGDVFRSSVAVGVLERQRRVSAVVSAVGAEVIDAPADKLAGACVMSYVRAKTRARV